MSLKCNVQVLLNKMKIVKPYDTRWLSHVLKAICKELPPLLQTHSQFSSHLEMLRHMVHTRADGVSSSYLLLEVPVPLLSCLCRTR